MEITTIYIAIYISKIVLNFYIDIYSSITSILSCSWPKSSLLLPLYMAISIAQINVDMWPSITPIRGLN